MISLIIGGSACGKSAFAENMLSQTDSKNKIYIATMLKYGDAETLARINKHKKMREKKNFKTLECPYSLGELTFLKTDAILLECMSNLVANEMFVKNNQNIENEIINAVNNINAKDIIIVTNNVFEDTLDYSEETKNYLKTLAKVNIALAKIATNVYEIRSGVHFLIKGENYDK